MSNEAIIMLKKYTKTTLILGIIYPLLIVIPTMILHFLAMIQLLTLSSWDYQYRVHWSTIHCV